MARDQKVPYRAGDTPSDGDPFSWNRDVTRMFDPFSWNRNVARMFDEFFRGVGPRMPMPGRSDMMLELEVDVSETENEFKICADLPGVDDKDVTVTLADSVLSISAERKHERHDDQESYHLVERSHGTMLRRLRLPNQIDADHVDANFENGVLTIRIPKTEKTQRSRRIDIHSGKSAGGERNGRTTAEQYVAGQNPNLSKSTPPM